MHGCKIPIMEEDVKDGDDDDDDDDAQSPSVFSLILQSHNGAHREMNRPKQSTETYLATIVDEDRGKLVRECSSSNFEAAGIKVL